MTKCELEEFQRLLELAQELRNYTHDWDWKYGEEWDSEMKRSEEYLEKERGHVEG